jgi:Na+:H+ antiporter, NhaA family
VSLEIKREILVGELSSPRRAALPIAAALGGRWYLLRSTSPSTPEPEAHPGGASPCYRHSLRPWRLGLARRAGPHGPEGLPYGASHRGRHSGRHRDALFYTSDISWGALAVDAAFLVALVGANLAGVGKPLVYGLLGIGLWLAFLESGVHATIAGVLLAMTVPASSFIDAGEFLRRSRGLLDRCERAGQRGDHMLSNEERELEKVLYREFGIEHTTLQVDHLGDHDSGGPRLQFLPQIKRRAAK